MIARTWTAELASENEAAYLEMVRRVVLPGLRAVSGYKGAQLLRRPDGWRVHVLVITWWESSAALFELTGGDPTRAYVPEEIAATLERFDSTATHFDLVVDDRVDDDEPGVQ